MTNRDKPNSSAKAIETQLLRLAHTTGEFMAYWGFKKIHGQAWALIYLSAQPLTATWLVRKLGVSKALVSLALKELSEYGLVRTISDPRHKIKEYVAVPDVMEVIRDVLKTREMHLLRSAQQAHLVLAELLFNRAPSNEVDAKRLKEVGNMITGASLCLKSMIEAPSLEKIGADIGGAEGGGGAG